MTWDWERVQDVVRRLKMPAGEYAVGRIGYGLSRDRSSTADRVELIVTEKGWRKLKERGWHERGKELRHPQHRTLTAWVGSLEKVRHEIVDVDGVPVIAIEPDPPAATKTGLTQHVRSAATGLVLFALAGALGYGFALYTPVPEPAVVAEHLRFGTTKVQATVEASSTVGSCKDGTAAYDNSARLFVDFAWIQAGKRRTGEFEGCGASDDSPQSIWVTDGGVIASQNPPWWDNLWAALLPGIVVCAFLVMPLHERFRDWRWRRRRAGDTRARG